LEAFECQDFTDAECEKMKKEILSVAYDLKSKLDALLDQGDAVTIGIGGPRVCLEGVPEIPPSG
jgi:hypothetical protein